MKIAFLTTDNRQAFRDYTCPTPYFGMAPEAVLQGLAALPEAEVHVISCLRQPVASPAKLAPNIFYHSLLVPKMGWMSTAYLGCIRATRRKIAALRVHIVHGQGTERDCAISAVFSGLPNVLTIHGNMAELARFFRVRIGSFPWLAARLEDLTLKRTAGVFCNSQYTEGLIRGRAPKTWRVPNALREEFFSSPRARRNPRPILLNVGEVSPRKRQLELLEVAARLHDRGCDFEFHFLGRCESAHAYGSAFLTKVAPLEEKGIAKYAGLKTGRELIAYFDKASALVHFPSEEAFGLVVAEGLARGLKFFGSRLGGIVDITNGVQDAELFEAEDWPALTSRLETWLKSGAGVTNNAVSLMRSRYHPSVIAARHLEIYREVLNGKN